MAFGNLKFDTLTTSGAIKGAEASVSADYAAHGSLKAWAVYDQNSFLSVGGSLNTSSVTDVGNAEGTVNFSNNFSATGAYIAIGAQGFSNASGNSYNSLCTLNDTANYTTSTARFFGPGWSGANNTDHQIVDFDINSRIFTGDLA